MKLIVGLGNPGKKYELTRHNLGFMVADSLMRADNAGGVAWEKFDTHSLIGRPAALTDAALLLKPQTFMNESGLSVRKVADYFRVQPDDVWVAHDDLDLVTGKIKIDFDASAAGHRGVASIIEHLGTQKFWRFRIGIGRPPENLPADAFVLQIIHAAEQAEFTSATNKACLLIKQSLSQGIAEVRNQPST